MEVNLIGVPIKYGSNIEGVQYGPDKLREANIVEIFRENKHTIYDLGNIYVPKLSQADIYKDHKKMKFLNPVKMVNENLAHAVYCSLNSQHFPFIIGGDHSLAIGSIAGASKYFENLAVIWVDAHGDINSVESSPSGNIHGMPLAASMGVGHPSLVNLYYEEAKIQAKNVYIVAARDLDPGEVELIENSDINLYSIDDIRSRGLPIILTEIINKLHNSQVDGIHFSFDIDSLDLTLVPGTGTPVADGLNVDEAKYIIRRLLSTKLITSMDFVELNPILDNKEEGTTKLSVELIKEIASHL